MSIVKKPIFVTLDRRRELVFNLLTEARVKGQKLDSGLWEKIGEYEDPKTGQVKNRLSLNLDNFAVYLWAAIYEDAHKAGELLTVEDVGRLVNTKKKADRAFDALLDALAVYYGDDEESEPGK
jgi:hypothetical protein